MVERLFSFHRGVSSKDLGSSFIARRKSHTSKDQIVFKFNPRYKNFIEILRILEKPSIMVHDQNSNDSSEKLSEFDSSVLNRSDNLYVFKFSRRLKLVVSMSKSN